MIFESGLQSQFYDFGPRSKYSQLLIALQKVYEQTDAEFVPQYNTTIFPNIQPDQKGLTE
jgi:hypothetical protein